MEKFKVDKNSWHYRLVDEHVTDKYPYDIREKAMPTNFCAYWRRVVIECMKNSIATIIVGGAILSILGGIGYLIYLSFTVATLADFAAVGGLVLFFVVAFFLFSLPDMIRKRKIQRLEEQHETDQTTPDNIFVTKYKSWKGKYCPTIEYERN